MEGGENSSSQQAEQYSGPNNLTISAALGKSYKKGDLFIPVMGITGSGKSTFISRLSDEPIEIGHDLNSSVKELIDSVELGTQEPALYTVQCSGKTVHLIDTPGFDDSRRNDFAVLNELTTWLNISYELNIRLSGVIYLHRITDPRMQGAALLNLRMFHKLVGEENMTCVVLATTKWDTVRGELELQRAYDRENHLKGEFWSLLIERGAKTKRHMNNYATAMDIVRGIVDMNSVTTLRVQKEMIEQHLKLSETSAGLEINREINEQTKKFQQEISDIKKEMEKAERNKDLKWQAELAKEKKDWEKKLGDMKKSQEDSQRSAKQQIAEKTLELAQLKKDMKEMRKEHQKYEKRSGALEKQLEKATEERDAASRENQVNILALQRAEAARQAACNLNLSGGGGGEGSGDGGDPAAATAVLVTVVQGAMVLALPAMLCIVM